MMKTAAIIVAAGSGTRFGRPKQFELLAGLPLYQHSILRFAESTEVDLLTVVAAPEFVERVSEELHELQLAKPLWVVAGGETRQQSVANGLQHCTAVGDVEFVLVHDAARALIDLETIARVTDAVRQGFAAVVAAPVVDTLKRVSEGKILATVPRQGLWKAQTPQGAPLADMLRAYNQAATDGFTGTDESELLERIGIRPNLIEGTERNFKVTYEEDLIRAAQLLC